MLRRTLVCALALTAAAQAQTATTAQLLQGAATGRVLPPPPPPFTVSVSPFAGSTMGPVMMPAGPYKFSEFYEYTNALPQTPGLYEIRILGTTTGYIERFLLQIPKQPQFPVTPMLVAFHGFGVSAFDVFFNTQLPQQAFDRGWYLLAPLGADDTAFSSIEAQVNTQQVLDIVTFFHQRIDPERVYGIGFSMGGGSVLNYAARHLDPTGTRFAAIVNHTGGVSLAHTYANDLAAQSILAGWHGGDPLASPFEYARSSVLDLDPLDDTTVDPTTDLARNLTHIPIQTLYGNQDPLAYLTQQCVALDAHLQSLGGDHTLIVVPAIQHTWDSIDFGAACDFLAQHTLTEPDAARTLVDQDARYFHFEVVQDQPGQFSPFEWSVDPQSNVITILETQNIQSIIVDTIACGLTSLANLTLTTSSADSTADEIVFTGVPLLPTSVTRDSVPDNTWVYDSQEQTLAISEPGSSASWQINF